MRVYYNTTHYKDFPKNCVMALGNFDGMHIGHQKVIRYCLKKAKELNKTAAILTFDPHPNQILRKKNSFKLICDFKQKIELIQNIGIKHVVVLSFNKVLSSLTPEEFIKQYLVQLFNVNTIVTGYNFSFGKQKKGNNLILEKFSKQYGFSFDAIGKTQYNDYVLSSSNIKTLLQQGSIGIVNKLLGRIYSVKGTVSIGKKIAKQIGTATANIILKNHIQYPLFGVYLVQIMIHNKKFYGIANIGVKPTFNKNNSCPLLEVHVLDFNQDIYNLEVEVEFLHFIRPERKFPNVMLLKEQIVQDIYNVRYILKNFSHSLEHTI